MCLSGGSGHVALAWQGHDELPLRSYFLKTALITVKTWPYAGTAGESTHKHTRTGDRNEKCNQEILEGR